MTFLVVLIWWSGCDVEDSVGMRRKIRRTLKNAYRYLLWSMGKMFVGVFRDMPRPITHLGMLSVYPFWTLFSLRYRRLALQQVCWALGVDEKKARHIVSDMFANIMANLEEFITLPFLSPRRIVEIVDGEEYVKLVKRLTRHNRGIIVATGHIGFWELFGAYSSLMFPTTVIAKRIYFPRYEKEVSYFRRRFGMRVVYQDEGIKPIIAALRRGEAIGMLVDQDISSVSGVYVRFFGREAYTPSAPSALAITTGAPILPAALIRINANRYRVEMEEPLFPPKRPQDKIAAKLKLTQQWTTALERIIKRHPEQWVWFHKRWKTRPEKTPAPRITAVNL